LFSGEVHEHGVFELMRGCKIKFSRVHLVYIWTCVRIVVQIGLCYIVETLRLML